MANSIKIDANHKGVIAGITDDSAQDIINIRVDPITNRVKTTIEPLDSTVDSVTIVTEDEVYQGYGLFAVLTEAGTTYILKENKTGECIMKRLVASTGTTTYSTGTSDASTAWTDRATITYDTYANTF